ncbi:LysM peptidoglycan-binding domain-containing protein [Niallia sp. Krafla_26]|uniref:3D domain-containing protein n=1 Tax=Niallia sp. Krafla_26 TaxID=3064703 RepID=UPI003D169C9A
MKLKHKIGSILTAVLIMLVGTNTYAEEITVQKGDTLWGLSQQYNTSVESLKKWNQLSDDLIYANDVLEVSPMKNVIIEEGDTLWNMSQVYGVSVKDLMEWNQLSSEIIHPGLELVIYTNKESLQDHEKPVQGGAAAKMTATKAPASEAPTGKEITVEATAYTAECEGCIGITKTGVDLKNNPDKKVIAVDPSVIPLGSEVYVEGYGHATAEDIGSGIKGHEVDVFIPVHEDALEWGRKQVKVTIID